MPPLVRDAVLLMFAAFTFYSLGVWAAFFSGQLQPWHAGLFWLGFISDTTGTEIMRRLAGGIHLSLHTATGALALLLMFIHAIWATLVLLDHAEHARRTFHRMSIVVWAIWLIPFVSGLILNRR